MTPDSSVNSVGISPACRRLRRWPVADSSGIVVARVVHDWVPAAIWAQAETAWRCLFALYPRRLVTPWYGISGIAALLLFAPAVLRAQEADPYSAYNQGVTSYQHADYESAGRYFQESLNTADRKLEQWAHYNLGNTRFQQAQGAAGDIQEALRLLKEAKAHFQRAAELNVVDRDARYNYELAMRAAQELEQLLESQPQPQPNSDQQPPQDKAPDDSSSSPAPAAESAAPEQPAPSPPAGGSEQSRATAGEPPSAPETGGEPSPAAAAEAPDSADEDTKNVEQALMLLEQMAGQDQMLAAPRPRQQRAVEKDW